MDRKSTRIFEDNEDCIQLTKNNTIHDRTEHIDVKYLKIVKNVKNDRIQVNSTASEDNIAYIMKTSL